MSENDNRELRNAMLAAQIAAQNPGAAGEGQPITQLNMPNKNLV